MKKFKKVSIIIAMIFSIILPIYSKALAKDKKDPISFEYTEEFKEYINLPEEERKNAIQPRAYEVVDTGIFTANPVYLAKLYGASLNKKFSLKDVIPGNIVVKNQQGTSDCWAFSALASLETNLAMVQDATKVYDFSERHMDYATSKTFANNTINPVGFDRLPGSAGNWEIALSYLTNGSGAIDESQMPFQNNTDIINISEIQNKTVTSQVYDTITFPTHKITDDLTQMKQQMKEHIKTYGAVVASIYMDQNTNNMEYTNRTTGAMYCNDGTKSINHQIALIGWDDDYEVSNFNTSHKPNNPGAWIAKNSWGTDLGDNGIMYISYEDIFVYNNVYGIIKSANSVDYENIYQYSEFGANGDVNIPSSKAYVANIFDKKTSGKEYIQSVAITLAETATCKVYVNPNGSDISAINLKEVALKEGASKTLGSGYHILEFETPVQIKENNFAVVVEMQGTRANQIKVPVEAKFTDGDHKIYSTVTIENSKCFITYGNTIGNNWIDLSKLTERSQSAQNVDNTIKAFTISNYADHSLNRIEITKAPTKTSYFEGENFNKNGMIVTAYYNDDTSKEIENYTIEDGNNLKNGQTSVKVKFEDKEASQTINVEKNTVESIKIKNPPTSTEYYAKHDFDVAGMVVEATYKDGTTKEITDYTITNGNKLDVSQEYVTISYGGKTVNQKITVKANPISELKIITSPTKVKYFTGDNFDTTGMVIYAVYEDGYRTEVKDYTIEGGTELAESQQYVTIKFDGKTVNQYISVVAKPENSDFSNIKATVKDISYYVFSDTNKQDYILLSIDISGIKTSKNSQILDYYYYLSNKSNESNIQNWVKIDENVSDGTLTFKIDTKDISNYNEIKDATDIYLYIKEVATSNQEQVSYISNAMKLEAKTGTNVALNLNDKTVTNKTIQANTTNSNSSNGVTSETYTGYTVAGSSSNDKTTTPASSLPKTGLKTVLAIIIIITILGVYVYIRYKNLKKYIK